MSDHGILNFIVKQCQMLWNDTLGLFVGLPIKDRLDCTMDMQQQFWKSRLSALSKDQLEKSSSRRRICCSVLRAEPERLLRVAWSWRVALLNPR